MTETTLSGGDFYRVKGGADRYLPVAVARSRTKGSQLLQLTAKGRQDRVR